MQITKIWLYITPTFLFIPHVSPFPSPYPFPCPYPFPYPSLFHEGDLSPHGHHPVLQGKVSLVYSLPSEKYWSRRQDKFSQLFQEGYVLLQCKAVKGKCQSKYRNVEKQSNSQTQRQKHNICPLGIRITQTNRLPSDCLKTQRQTHKVYPLKVRAKGSEHS